MGMATWVLLIVSFGAHGGVISGGVDGGVWLVDRQNDQLLLARSGQFTAYPVDAWPHSVALDFAGRPVVTCRGAGSLVRLEADGGLSRLSMVGGPTSLAISDDGKQATVGFSDAPKVAHVDLGEWAVVNEVTLPAPAVDVALDRQWAYALLGAGGALERVTFADAGVVEVMAPVARRRGLQLANAGQSVLALTRDTIPLSADLSIPTVQDRAFLVGDRPKPSMQNYFSRVVPGSLTVGRERNVVAFEDGTIADADRPNCDKRDHWRLEGVVSHGRQWLGFSPTERMLVWFKFDGPQYLSTNPGWVEITRLLALPEASRSKALLRGERLFSMQSSATSFRGFSCETCHPGGGTDGLSWSLKGRKSVATPAAKASQRDEKWLQRHAVMLEGEGFSDPDIKALLLYLTEGVRAAH